MSDATFHCGLMEAIQWDTTVQVYFNKKIHMEPADNIYKTAQNWLS